MFLVPPRDIDPGRGALYFISVKLNLNPFAPLSYVTTVHRGSDAEGEFVGEFESVLECWTGLVYARWSLMSSVLNRLGIAHPRATVTIGSYSTRLKNILSNDTSSQVSLAGSVINWTC